MKKFTLLFVFLMGFFLSTDAQMILALDINGIKNKRIRYNSGDYIAVKVLNDKTTYKGYLDIINDSTFFINANLVHIDSVRAIVKYNRAPKAISKQAFLVAGITGVITIMNNSFTKGEAFPNDNSYIVPAAFAGIGAVLIPFWKKNHKITGKKKSLKILDLNPAGSDGNPPPLIVD